jgi:hypothetical protein
VHPAASAGATLSAALNSGAFQGTIAPTTPTGVARTRTSLPNTPVRVRVHG